MGLIYMRISPSGGKYIGQTIQTEEHRWRDHCKNAHNENSEEYSTILNKAIRKYGDNSFSVTILEDNLPIEQLNEREKYWIDYYKTYYLDNNHGYNMTLGGDSGPRTKSNSTPVLQYDLSGKFIKQWDSAAKIVETYNDELSNILLVLNHGRLHSYKKYLWKYIDDNTPIEQLILNYKYGQAERSYKSTEVYCVEMDTYYPSFSQAEKELNVSRKMISKYAKLGIAEPKSQLHFIIIKGENK